MLPLFSFISILKVSQNHKNQFECDFDLINSSHSDVFSNTKSVHFSFFVNLSVH